MSYLTPQYDVWGVLASIVIACLASYVTLDLARRVRTPERGVALGWWIGGSLVMGTGIWSMHFVGMLAFSLPLALGYTELLTFLSWVAAVVVSAIALGLASGAITPWRIAFGSVAMGAGICAMHYTGMAALDMLPGIVWNWALVGASVFIAVAASAAALTIFFLLRAVDDRHSLLYQAMAAVVMGAAISGMHYTGMAAANFPEGTVCRSANSLGGQGLGGMVALACGVILVLTLVMSILDTRMRGKAQWLASSLQMANAELLSANNELRKRAFLDPLTNLPNRLLFEDRLAHALSRGERAEERIGGRKSEKLAVMFIDLDGFKPVNDSFGHAAGDVVLKETAARLLREARDSDTVARVGGDEFLLLMEDAGSTADCVTLARRLVAALSQPFEIAGKQIQISCSVGVVVYPDHGQKDKLVANADAAMYAAKRAGGGTYALFESHMDAGALEQLNLQNDLRHAIERGQLELYYQPKIDGKRGRINGVEALIRWNHPERGMLSPGLFIPLAERFGLIGKLGNWVIAEACRQIEAWADAGVRMRVAINLSVHQLREEDLVDRIEGALLRHKVDAAQLLCEITESVAMEDMKATQRAFEGLARIGVFLSIDDFGTGYSSLSYLRQLPARQLKIDASFVNDLETSADARAVVDAVIRLSHALDLRVVAEGVETQGQSEILLAMGCDELQGFFFARPMPAATLLQWTEGRKPEGSVDFTSSVMGSL
ncbi:MAG TPA: EAL domain-containing protein [Burkholderiaceae bacterium]|nr:EAL domain-containing protein [Burkholderiaceae bacterium]